MVNTENGEELYHGVDILNDNLQEFKITDKPICSFQDWLFICSNNELFRGFIPSLIETIIFDAIIGNTDRHTENWAFIRSLTEKSKKLEINWKQTLFSIINLKPKIHKKLRIEILNKFQFSPIYDSGSCLGREIPEKSIAGYLNDKNLIMNYIIKGKSEIKWNNEEFNFFEIAKKVNQIYPQYVEEIMKKVIRENIESEIDKLVDNIDVNTQSTVKRTLLSANRKELIKRLIKERIKFLKNTIQND